MFGIGDQKGVTLPQLFAPKMELSHSEDIAVSGSKTQRVQTYSHQRNVMLPHISQKSQRPVPKTIHRVAVNTDQSSMLEALEIYKKSRMIHSPDQKEVRMSVFQSVPCPTPIEPGKEVEIYLKPMNVPSQTNDTSADTIESRKSAKKSPLLSKQRTFMKQLPVSTTLQKRLEKLAKHKSMAAKKQQQSVKVSIRTDADPKMTIRNGNATLPVLKGESMTTRRMHYSFNTTLLPKIKENPRQSTISYQLLEIPVRVTKPERKGIMFNHTHYDIYQHSKFDNRGNKKLSIVGGPEARLDSTVWDYNKFLYLNVKI